MRSDGDDMLIKFNPDNMIEKVGPHRIIDKKASFIGSEFSVNIKK